MSIETIGGVAVFVRGPVYISGRLPDGRDFEASAPSDRKARSLAALLKPHVQWVVLHRKDGTMVHLKHMGEGS